MIAMQIKHVQTGKTKLFLIQLSLLLSSMLFINTSANAQANCEGNCEPGSETPCFTVNLPAPNSSVNLTLFGGGNCCDLQIPDNYNCVQLYVNYPAGTAGLEITSTANPHPVPMTFGMQQEVVGIM